MKLNSIEEIVEDIRQGKMVILMDDEDRENEGDILVAAEKITPDIVNFMAAEGRGLICLTITAERAEMLGLQPMVTHNTEQFGTNFTVSIEAAEGVTTGISAKDRAVTIKTATMKNASANDIVSPGHVFPIVAKSGGVLVRAGHTEAGCDLAKLAGLEPSCAIVEVLNEDGTMARRPQLETFAQEHNIKLGTIADLIQYRLAHESVIEKINQKQISTEFGTFELHTYQDLIENQLHYALCNGDIKTADAVTVRVHIQDTLKDALHISSESWTLTDAMKQIAAAKTGVLLMIGKPESREELLNKLQEVEGPIKAEKNRSQEIGIGSQILHNLGIKKMKLLSSGQTNYHALSGFELEVEEYICKGE